MQFPESRTLPGLLDEQALLHPDRIAVIAHGQETTFATLAGRVRRLSNWLRSHGVVRGTRVGLILGNRIEWLEICFAVGAAGGVVVPISTWSKQGELAYILHDADIHTLFSMARAGTEDFVASLQALVPEATGDRWQSDQLPALKNLVLVDDDPALPGAGWQHYAGLADSAGEAAADDRAEPHDDALILYTSGSTSKPKAVRLAHYGLIENGFNIGERQHLTADDRVFVPVPLFWAYGSANALPAAISHGATLVLQERFEPGEAISLIEHHRCTAIYTLPAITAALIGHPTFAPARTASLRTGLTIGNAQDVMNAAEQLGAHSICNIYGSSETYGNCCVTPSDWPLARRAACQGPPLPGVSIRLVDPETGAGVPVGSPGLIEVHGYLTAGYGGQSMAQNAEAFTSDKWYRSGDIGELTDQGDLVFLGRNSEMIKRSGINVSPAEVEDVLMQHPAVTAAAVVGAPDANLGEAIIAFVVGKGISEADMIAHCRTIASRYKVPDRIVFRDQLPVTVTGKLQRQPLKAEARCLVSQEV